MTGVRKAQRSDARLLRQMILEMGQHERLPVLATEERLAEDVFGVRHHPKSLTASRLYLRIYMATHTHLLNAGEWRARSAVIRSDQPRNPGPKLAVCASARAASRSSGSVQRDLCCIGHSHSEIAT
jgi:hypothetical protein